MLILFFQKFIFICVAVSLCVYGGKKWTSDFLLYMCLELDSSPLQNQQMILTTKPPL